MDTNNIQHHQRTGLFFIWAKSLVQVLSLRGAGLKIAAKFTNIPESEKDTTPQKYQPYASTTRPQLPLPDLRQSSVSAGTPQTAP